MIQSQNNAVTYAVSGNEYIFPYKFFTPSDLTVYLDSRILVKDIDWTIENKEDYSGGARIFLKENVQGKRLTIMRVIPFTQGASFPTYGKLDSKTLEQALDKLTMIAQQLQEENSRAIKTSPTDETTADALLQSVYLSANGAVNAAAAAGESAQRAALTAQAVEAAGKAAVDAAGKAASEAAGSVEEVREALRKSAGLPIGSIFAYPGAVPPEGAYLLNGQTIAGCNELYPKFWAWLVENAGVMEATPVYKAWTMPALTADGTLGGAEYGAAASGAAASGYNAYKSFDGVLGASSSFANIAGVKSGWLTWYSPVKLKFTQVLFRNQTSGSSYTNRMASFAIYGSNDNATWTELASGAYNSTANSATQLVDIPESKFNADTPGYHYLKIEAVNGGGSNMDFPEITIYGQEYLYTDYAGDGNILTMSEEAYEYTLARTGVCGGFVVNSALGSVRLPSVVNGTLWGADISNIGQSLSAGLPNITGNFNGNQLIDDNAAAKAEFNGAFKNGEISMSSPSGASDKSQMGIGFDASASNPIYGNSDTVQPPAIRVSYCIQVFNAATALSEQESAQLAVLMQTKAQLNLANVDSNIDYVVESWNDGAGGWYRKYRSGWVEQGGYSLVNTGVHTVTLWVEMADANYSALISFSISGSSSDTDGATSCPLVSDRTTTTIRINQAKKSGDNSYWEVKGYAATE